ncbi:ice-binding family protein [Nocardioides sp.]|uniref:ice-binding family protein n=1 Tax=Nocardioides sp. TaxID=35761 RepID=UPI002735084D|nr:ice-binding family protein [Nocardioides sp.]MDP3889959.1 ice-binding family protein [Nocardioides sp.]
MSLRRHIWSVPAAALLMATALAASPAAAAQPQVGLGTATSFAVLAGTTVTNTGPTSVNGDLGVSPGDAVVGFPPGTVSNGTIHAGNAVALNAQDDLTTAYNDAAGRTPAVDKTGQDLAGQTLLPGVYNASSEMALTGTVTLDAQGDPDAVFIFQAGSTLITGSNSTVALVGEARACNVFWQVGSSATFGTDTTFAGTVMALTSIEMLNGASIEGRLLARNGAVTLDDNTITRTICAAAPPSGGPSATGTPSTSPGPTGAPTSGSGGPTGGSTAGGDQGGGSGDGGGGDSGAPDYPIPVGHPETGTAPGPDATASLWLLSALACTVGAAAVALWGPRRRRRSTPS